MWLRFRWQFLSSPGRVRLRRRCCRAVNDLWALAVLIGIIAAVGCACAIAFLLAKKVARALGVTGNIELARLLGVLLAALAVLFVIDGLRTAFG
jgi:multiple antibiotic resistance protein